MILWFIRLKLVFVVIVFVSEEYMGSLVGYLGLEFL